MFQGVAGQLLVDAVSIPTPTAKHETMVRALLSYSAQFVEEV
jgi:predicted dehydrogenase